MDFDCFVLVGDYNIHVDNPKDGRTKELLNILDNFGLSHNCAVFAQGFTPSPTPPSALVDDLVNRFSSDIMAVIDSIVPVKTKEKSHPGETPHLKHRKENVAAKKQTIYIYIYIYNQELKRAR